MRNTIWLFLFMGCGPRGVVDGTGDASDADADADADSDADSDADTDTGLTGADCTAGPTPGAWDDHPITLDGAPVTTAAYTNDAGIDDVLAAADGQFDPVAVTLPITEATVTAIGHLPDKAPETILQFWFEDANGAAVAWYIEVGMDPHLIRVGDKVSFTATEVLEYFGTTEVTAATGFTLVSSGNPVRVIDGMSGAPLSFAQDGNSQAEVWGQLVSDPEDCGGWSCFDMTYGSNTLLFRTDSDFNVVGDCIHWIGPIGEFSGQPQLNAYNFDWYTYY